MKFTVFSACFNSSAFIDRLFKSITEQSFRDFEWIVFDDDSSDNTIELIEKFISATTDIPVRFIKNKPNKGMTYSYLEAVRLARGKYLVQWDHDDIHKPHELEVFSKVVNEYDDGNLAGIWALCEDQNGKLLGNRFPGYISVGNYFTHYLKYITIYGNKVAFNERMPCINVEKIRNLDEYRKLYFPDGTEEQYPSFRWALLSMAGFKIVYINEIVRTYFIHQNHISLSNQHNYQSSLNIFKSNIIWINIFFKYLKTGSFKFKLNIYKSLVYHGILSGHSVTKLQKPLKKPVHKIIVTILYYPVLIYRLIACLKIKQRA